MLHCFQKKTEKTSKADVDLAAKLLGVTQPSISDLVRGKINLFALDALVNMAVAAGLRIELRVLQAA